jgi:SHS2 domain-containing protein
VSQVAATRLATSGDVLPARHGWDFEEVSESDKISVAMFEVFEHTADLGLRIRAADRAGLFVEAARGLFSVLVANPQDVRGVEQRTYQIQGDEDDYLLFDWLNELLYTFDTEHLLLAEFDVEFRENGLLAVCRGEPADPARHDLDHEVKAITYHGLRVDHDDDGWFAEVIVDI